MLDRWLAYFDRLGIEGIASGAVILRRRSGGPNWVRADELAGDRLRPGRRADPARVRRGRLPGRRGDERAVLDGTFALAERPGSSSGPCSRTASWALAEVALDLEEGLGFHAALDPGTAELLAALDGRRPLATVVEELAARQKVDRDGLAHDARRRRRHARRRLPRAPRA